jgi:hypothetical protein
MIREFKCYMERFIGKLPSLGENPNWNDVIICLFVQFMFSWMLGLKLTQFQIFVHVRLDNN